jgi:hypothetical protein
MVVMVGERAAQSAGGRGGELLKPGDITIEEWEELSKMVGRNGVVLYVGALLWWIEAVAGAEEDSMVLADNWLLAVDDFTLILSRP